MRQLLLICILLFSLTNEAQKLDFKHINFKRADSIANTYQDATLKNLPLLAYRLTKGLHTQVEKFRAIYTWVCSNIASDYDFGELILRKRKQFKHDSIASSNWNSKLQSKVFQKLLKEQKTMCSGYAYLVKELSNLADINCEIVDGYSRTIKHNIGKIDIPNHSWNAVKLNNKWYFVDATLASGYFNIDTNTFIKNYNDGYFLAPPELYITKYYPLNKKWITLNNKPSLCEFVNAPVTYGNTFKYIIIPEAPKTMLTKVFVQDEITFKFSIGDELKKDDILLVLSNGLRYKTIKPSHDNFKEGKLEITHRFTKKGNYDVYLMVKKDIVVSFVVKVRKSKNNNI